MADKDPRDVLADYYEEDPARYLPLRFGNQKNGVLQPCCPAGGLVTLGAIPEDRMDPVANPNAVPVSHWVLGEIDDAGMGTPWPDRDLAPLGKVLRHLRERLFPFDDKTLGLAQ
jgi:hypothetical protein